LPRCTDQPGVSLWNHPWAQPLSHKHALGISGPKSAWCRPSAVQGCGRCRGSRAAACAWSRGWHQHVAVCHLGCSRQPPPSLWGWLPQGAGLQFHGQPCAQNAPSTSEWPMLCFAAVVTAAQMTLQTSTLAGDVAKMTVGHWTALCSPEPGRTGRPRESLLLHPAHTHGLHMSQRCPPPACRLELAACRGWAPVSGSGCADCPEKRPRPSARQVCGACEHYCPLEMLGGLVRCSAMWL